MVDECTGPKVAKWLKSKGHEVYSIYDEARGMTDERIIAKANKENYILITNDKDFGELITRQKKPHKGVLLLRLRDERTEEKIKIINQILREHSEKLAGNFIIATEQTIRIIEEEKVVE